VGVVTRCVTHEAEKGGKAAHNDCQNVERALREIAENSVPKHMVEEFAVSLLHRKRVSRMPCRHSLFFLSYLQYQFWYSPIGLPSGRRTSWITWSRCFSVDEVIISSHLETSLIAFIALNAPIPNIKATEQNASSKNQIRYILLIHFTALLPQPVKRSQYHDKPRSNHDIAESSNPAVTSSDLHQDPHTNGV